jgi:hypothetical protein
LDEIASPAPCPLTVILREKKQVRNDKEKNKASYNDKEEG